MDALQEASAKYMAAEQFLVKKLFKKPNYEEAAECFTKAANLFKVAKNYERSGEAFERAYRCYKETGNGAQASAALNNAINSFNVANPAKSSELIEDLIQAYAKTGKFLQAGKACIQQGEKLEENQRYLEARQSYERAVELLQAENNVDSELRNAQQKVAELMATREQQYLPAAKMFEEIGTKCLKVKLLQFHARGYFFLSYLCTMLLDDEIALEELNGRYRMIDPNMDGSAEGDFMNECLEAVKAKSGDAYLQAYAKLNGRSNLRSNIVAKTLLGQGQRLFKEADDAQEGDVETPGAPVAQNDDDML